MVIVLTKLRSAIINYARVKETEHAGRDITEEFVRRTFFWPNMGLDVKKIFESCALCMKFKPTTTAQRIPLCPIKPVAPFHSWHSDYIGPFPVSDSGNRFILMFIDRFTKKVEAFAVPDQTAETTKKGLAQLISRFGIPYTIDTDQGTQYESYLFNKFCNEH